MALQIAQPFIAPSDLLVSYSDDLTGAGLQLLAKNSAGVAQLSFWGLPNMGGVPSIPSGWTAAQLQNHIGLGYVQTAALNDKASLTFSGVDIVTTGQYGFFPLFSAPSFLWSCVFTTPNVLSTAGDRYRFTVGWGGLNSLTTGLDGPCNLFYSDNVNSGKWQLVEGLGAQEGDNVLIANSTVAPVANTWNTLQFFKPANTKTIQTWLNGVNICSGAGFIAQDPMPAFGGGGMWMVRDTFTSGTHTAFMDKISLVMSSSTIPIVNVGTGGPSST